MRFLWKSQIRQGEKKSRQAPKKTRRIPSDAEKKPPFFLAFLWFFLLATLVYVLIFSPFLLLDSVRVTGTAELSGTSLEDFVRKDISGKWLGFVPKNSFLLFQPVQMEKKIAERFPLAESVSVSRVFPGHLEIVVQERSRLVLWCSGGPCYLVGANGRAEESRQSLEEENREYRIVITDTSAQPVRQGQRLFDFDLPGFAQEVESVFRDRLGLEVGKEYETSSRFAHELRLKTAQNFFIYISTDIPIEKTTSDLRLLFEKELPEEIRSKLEYIDARTENRIYYRLSGEPVVVADALTTSADQSGGE